MCVHPQNDIFWEYKSNWKLSFLSAAILLSRRLRISWVESIPVLCTWYVSDWPCLFLSLSFKEVYEVGSQEETRIEQQLSPKKWLYKVILPFLQNDPFIVSLIWSMCSKMWILSFCKFCIWPFSSHWLWSLMFIVIDILLKIK